MVEPRATSPGGPWRLLLVGLGAISEVHRRALELVPDLAVVAGVDIRPHRSLRFRGASLPVYREVDQALTESGCDAVIVSVPTPDHAAVLRVLLGSRPSGDLLVEKPMALDLEEISTLQTMARAGGITLRVLYHAAYGEEVGWARAWLPRLLAEHGPLRLIDASHADAYEAADPARTASLVSSWVDSGINALSILHRLVSLDQPAVVRELDSPFSTFEASVGFRCAGASGRADLLTTWQADQAAKVTRLHFDDGSELTLDHIARSAELRRDGLVVESRRSDAALPRLVAQYVSLFEERYRRVREEWSDADDLRLHSLLLPPAT